MKKGESTFVYFRLSASTKRFLDTTANQFLSPRQIKKKRKPSLQPELGENNAEIEMDTCVLYLSVSQYRAKCTAFHPLTSRILLIASVGTSVLSDISEFAHTALYDAFDESQGYST